MQHHVQLHKSTCMLQAVRCSGSQLQPASHEPCQAAEPASQREAVLAAGNEAAAKQLQVSASPAPPPAKRHKGDKGGSAASTLEPQQVCCVLCRLRGVNCALSRDLSCIFSLRLAS